MNEGRLVAMSLGCVLAAVGIPSVAPGQVDGVADAPRAPVAERFAQQQRDARWADEMEAAYRAPGMVAEGSPVSAVREVECKASTCRLKVVPRGEAGPRLLEWFARGESIQHVKLERDGDGSWLLHIDISRGDRGVE